MQQIVPKQPNVFVVDDRLVTNSRDVAEFFKKRHDNVMRDIDKLVERLKSQQNQPFHSFEEVDEIVELGGGATRKVRTYNMDKDALTLLTMGFTGEKALGFKLQYIERFNDMERVLKEGTNRFDPMASLNDPIYLRKLVVGCAERMEQLEVEKAEMQPKVEALEKIADADGSLCVTDAAKALQMRPKDLFSYLDRNGWTYKRPGNTHRLGYQSRVVAGLLVHKVGTTLLADGSERITEQVRVTPKGITKLAMLIKPLQEVA
ncbi:MAG: phage regulatory protein/antirepressor Ant [Hyphomicrobiaceae bacterium]